MMMPPDSRTPRRLMTVMMTRIARHIARVCDCKEGAADASGNSHGHHQNVVDHERYAGQQTGMRSQILARHRVGPASTRISANSLPVGKKDDDEQNYDRGADGNRVVNTSRAQSNQYGERCFGAVGGGTQRIQTEHTNAG